MITWNCNSYASCSFLNHISICVHYERHRIFIDFSAITNRQLKRISRSFHIGMDGCCIGRGCPLCIQGYIMGRHCSGKLYRIASSQLIVIPPGKFIAGWNTFWTSRCSAQIDIADISTVFNRLSGCISTIDKIDGITVSVVFE